MQMFIFNYLIVRNSTSSFDGTKYLRLETFPLSPRIKIRLMVTTCEIYVRHVLYDNIHDNLLLNKK